MRAEPWRLTGFVICIAVLLLVSLPTPGFAQEDNTGTNPVNFTYDFRLIAEMAGFDGGGSLLTTTAELRWPLGRNLTNLTGEGPDSPFHHLGSLIGVRIRARYSNLSIPTPGAAPFGTSEVSGIGDVDRLEVGELVIRGQQWVRLAVAGPTKDGTTETLVKPGIGETAWHAASCCIT